MELVEEGKACQGALMLMSILLPFGVMAWFLADCAQPSHLSHQCSSPARHSVYQLPFLNPKCT